MIGEPPFNTATMAALMAEQGHCSRAIAIYRELVQRHPNRPEYQEAMDRLERQRSDKQLAHLEPVLAEWIHALLKTSRKSSRSKSSPVSDRV